MTEPRSISMASDRWLTDSRVYSLIWMGRWLERSEYIARAAKTAALKANQDGNVEQQLNDSLCELAASLGIPVEDRALVASDILFRNPASSVLQCLVRARVNATQVAPVELMRSISEVVLDLEEVDDKIPQTSDQIIQITTNVSDGLSKIYQAIEDRWFGKEALTEEEVYHRFVQQQ